MADLMGMLSSPDAHKPMMITIIGEQGLGKTSLAATYPNPVFIRTEDGTSSIKHMQNVKLFPVARSSAEVMEQIKLLGTSEHDFRTLVIDSITSLHAIIEAEIVDSDPKARSINQAHGGYGAGYKEAANIHRQIFSWCERLREKKNMAVVFIGHTQVETFQPADDEPYNRYTLRMHKDSVQPYSDRVDIVAHVKLKVFTSGNGEKKKASSTGERVIVCHAEPTSIAKNRYGIEAALPFDKNTNPILEAVYGKEN